MTKISSPYHPSLLSPGTSHQIPTSAKNKLKAQSGSTVWGCPRPMGTRLVLSFRAAWARPSRCRWDSRTHRVQHRAAWDWAWAWAWALSSARWRASQHRPRAPRHATKACWAWALPCCLSARSPCMWLLQWAMEARATRCSRALAVAAWPSRHMANAAPSARLLRPSRKARCWAWSVRARLTSPRQAWKWLQNRSRGGPSCCPSRESHLFKITPATCLPLPPSTVS